MKSKKVLKIILSTFVLIVPLLVYAENGSSSYERVIDSLSQLLERTTATENRVNILNDISYNYRRINPDLGLDFARKAVSLAQSNNYKEGLVVGLKNIGIAHYRRAAPADTILHYYKKSGDLAKEIGDYNTQAACLNNSALVYRNLKQYSLAIGMLFDGLEALKKSTKKNNRLKVLMIANIGSFSTHNEEYLKAEDYLIEAVNLAKQHNYPDIVSMYQNDIAHVKIIQNELDDAEKILVEAMTFQQRHTDYASLAEWHFVMALLQEKRGQVKEALESLKEANKLSKKHRVKDTEIRYLLVMTRLARKGGDTKQALVHAQNALNEANAVENTQLKAKALKELASLYAENRDYESAFLIQTKYTSLSDSLHQDDKVLHTKGVERTREIQLEKDKLLLEQEQEQKQKKQAIIGIGIGFFSLVSFLWILKNKNKELKIASKKAVEASEVKQHFLSSMSHEIRTPMNAVIGFSDILLQEKPRQDQMPYLENLRTSSYYLMDLLNDVLDFSKLEANKVHIEKIPFDLEMHLSSIIEIFNISNQNEALKIIFNYDVPTRHKILGDPTRLKQILANLIGNAIKFTPNGYVYLNVKSLHLDEKETILHFEVKDTGIGIPMEKQQSIFESFSQASSTTTREFGGTGLGLSITKQLIELQGGKIQVSSKEGEGSVFSFQLEFPITTEVLDLQQSTKQFQVDNQLKGTNILLAEDNKFNQKVATKILERYGATISLATNGEEAIQSVLNQDFDMVLMDLHMPVMDGFDAIKHIRSLNSPKAKTPMIALTAASVEELTKYPLLSDIAYVSKPFKAEQLILMILQNLKVA